MTAIRAGGQRIIHRDLPRALASASYSFIMGANLRQLGGDLADALAAIAAGLRPEQLDKLRPHFVRGFEAGAKARIKSAGIWVDVPASWRTILRKPRRDADPRQAGAALAQTGEGDLALAVAAISAVIDPKTPISERVAIFTAIAKGWCAGRKAPAPVSSATPSESSPHAQQ